MMKSAEEAIQAYSDKFGGWPYFLFMGAAESVIIKAVEESLRTGKRIDIPDEDVMY